MRLNRDSVKLAAAIGAVLLVLLFLLRATGSVDGIAPWLIVAIPLATAFVAYALAVRMIIRPVRDVVRLLHRVETRDFSSLPAASVETGDMASLQRAVVDTGRALEKQMADLTRIENYRKDYLGNVSHELKTPIFAIHGFAETLLDGAIETEVRVEFVEKILRNAIRLDNLASDLSEIAKIETGELKMEASSVKLEPLIAEVIEALEPRARPKNIKLSSRVTEELPRVHADEGRIRQVLLNLAENGVKYTNEGGHVTIAARRSGETVRVTVSDSGIGIAAEHLGRVTERFYRVDTSRSRSQGGTGLGLAIVKHILSAHDSRLEIESAPDRGSAFSFSIRIDEDDAVGT